MRTILKPTKETIERCFGSQESVYRAFVSSPQSKKPTSDYQKAQRLVKKIRG